MKTFILIFLSLVFSSIIYAQNEVNVQDKPNIEDSKSAIIAKYRNLVIDNIISNNRVKTKELFYYMLQQLDNDYYIALYPSEKLMIALSLRDYSFVLSEITKTDSVSLCKLNKKVRPQNDQLYRILSQSLTDNNAEITDDLKNSTMLTSEDKELVVMIKNIYTSQIISKVNQNSINAEASSFIKNYPKSKFETYVRNYIRYEYRPSGFSLGMEFYSGAAIFNKSTQNYFDNGGFIGFGFIWGIDRLNINTRAAFVFSGLSQDVNYKDYIWQKGERAQIFLPELSLEYKFKPKKKLSLSPIIGIGWFSAAPYQTDKDKNVQLKNVNITSNGSPIIGFDIGWEFYETYYYNNIYNRLMHAFSSCNIRYIFQPNSFSSSYKDINGFSHNLSISYKFGLGGAKRLY